MKKISLKILIYTFFFVVILFSGFKFASAVSATDPGYYGYRSRKIVTEALVKHTEIPEWKQIALINMLSKDGYFWMKTKQEKLDYIHAKLSTSRYLTIVADAENVHSWSIKPITTKTVSFAQSKQTNQNRLVLSGQTTKPYVITIKGTKFIFQGGDFGRLGYTVRQDKIGAIADHLAFLRERVKQFSRSMDKDISTNPVVVADTFVVERGGSVIVGAWTDISNNSINIQAWNLDILMPIMDTGMRAEGLGKFPMITHEFGHALHAVDYVYLGKITPTSAGSIMDKMDKMPITVFNANWNTIYTSVKNNYNIIEKLNMVIVTGDHPWDTDTELFTSIFIRYLGEAGNYQKNPPHYQKIDDQTGWFYTGKLNLLEQGTGNQFKIKKKDWNLFVFAWENMATLIDGDSPSKHPFIHKPIKKIYNINEIYEGKFYNE